MAGKEKTVYNYIPLSRPEYSGIKRMDIILMVMEWSRCMVWSPGTSTRKKRIS
jgi:hypothetical protein